MRKTLLSLTIFFALSGCATEPKLNLNWEFLTNPKGETKACISEDEVVQLKTALIFCEANK